VVAPAVEEKEEEEEEEEGEGGGGVVLALAGGSAPGLTYRSSRSLSKSFTVSVVWIFTPLCERKNKIRRESARVEYIRGVRERQCVSGQ